MIIAEAEESLNHNVGNEDGNEIQHHEEEKDCNNGKYLLVITIGLSQFSMTYSHSFLPEVLPV